LNGSPSGSGGSGIVIIRYPFVQTAEFTSVTANLTAASEGSNVFFVVRTNFANANTLFYDTIGNVTSASFVGGNTGSFVVTNNETVVRLETTATIPANEERIFALRIRQDAANGSIRLTSQNVYVYDSATSLYIAATGGNVITSGGYRTHIFTTSNNFVVTDTGKLNSIEYFMVAGGAAGAYLGPYVDIAGGGGGAGGVLFGSSTVVANTYVVTVGAGGAATVSTSANGGNSRIVGATTIGPGTDAVGGGTGGNNDSRPGKNGGSGGGSSTDSPGNAGSGFGTGTIGSTRQGFPGGPSAGRQPAGVAAGGGGGAGGAGTRSGGAGISSPISPSIPGFFGTPGPTSDRWFAGGGGGGGGPSLANGAGGVGGGGAGGVYSGAGGLPGTSANVNTGGGGGGAAQPVGPAAGGAGGSGIVIIRYPFV
jgi:hypothetical protein